MLFTSIYLVSSIVLNVSALQIQLNIDQMQYSRFLMEKQGIICVFHEVLSTYDTNKTFAEKVLSEKQKLKISTSSRERKDNFVLPNMENLFYHTGCYADYTSKLKIMRYLDKKRKESSELDSAIPPKRLRR